MRFRFNPLPAAPRLRAALTRFILCSTHVFPALAAAAGERLYNGIELPAQWPPLRSAADILARQPMEAPYLKRPPALISIDVGRQLFVDDFLIQDTTLTRRFHRAEPHPGNPVLRPERPLPAGYPTAMPFSDGCFYDPQDRLFKIWYLTDGRLGTGYATSVDGISWKKQGEIRIAGAPPLVSGDSRDSSSIWLDHDAADIRQRFKMFTVWRHTRPDKSYVLRGAAYVSPDGIDWSAQVWTGPCGDRSTMFYNPFRRVWVFSLRDEAASGPVYQYEKRPYQQLHRARRYWEAHDFLAGSQWAGGDMRMEFRNRIGAAWRNSGEKWAMMRADWPAGAPAFWVGADERDHSFGPNSEQMDAELYNLDATPYESLMLGFFSVNRDNERKGRPKINELELGFSRDGFHWDRPFRQAVVPVDENPKSWNYGNVQSVGGGCLVVGDRLYIYASGRNREEDTTGLFFLRRDGFASMEAEGEEATLTTRPVTFSGSHVFVNFSAPQGELRVEMLTADLQPIADFAKARCVPVTGDSARARVEWSGGDFSTLAGRPVRFRFHLTNGALYSFWVSPDKNGASHGYVAAGGPGLSGSRDNVGAATP